jgi:hypothetical protein
MSEKVKNLKLEFLETSSKLPEVIHSHISSNHGVCPIKTFYARNGR